MDNLAGEFCRFMHRLHCNRPKFKGNGELTNVEFFLLLGIYAVVNTQNGCPQCMEIDDRERKNAAIAWEGKEKDNNVKGEAKKNGITLGEIIGITEMSMSAASKKISILEKKGLVVRNPSKTDRRNVYVTLTDKGSRLCVEEIQKKQVWLKELIARVGEKDMRQLLEIANKVLDEVNKMEKE